MRQQMSENTYMQSLYKYIDYLSTRRNYLYGLHIQ